MSGIEEVFATQTLRSGTCTYLNGLGWILAASHRYLRMPSVKHQVADHADHDLTGRHECVQCRDIGLSQTQAAISIHTIGYGPQRRENPRLPGWYRRSIHPGLAEESWTVTMVSIFLPYSAAASPHAILGRHWHASCPSLHRNGWVSTAISPVWWPSFVSSVSRSRSKGFTASVNRSRHNHEESRNVPNLTSTLCFHSISTMASSHSSSLVHDSHL